MINFGNVLMAYLIAKEMIFLEIQLDKEPKLKMKNTYASLILIKINKITINLIHIILLKHPFSIWQVLLLFPEQIRSHYLFIMK